MEIDEPKKKDQEQQRENLSKLRKSLKASGKIFQITAKYPSQLSSSARGDLECQLFDLPNEILLYIFSYLDMESLLTLSLCNKQL